ncbi:hypothetical protein DP939_16170 [Spongiactinospora rosea]|uniref:Uncharacterized protein n=1 Tax=Spongiactinospora rosea TaxID=2248750 RepID=A0A366LYV5_9ACTN|nr:hypothetical protein [Spongiactinospora rosea]RBQ18760.1 hypothetical protein DP939_16170 [Spongiactinospora rosea]
MSKTDKTRPLWVRMADRPPVTCVPVHDHRDGVCTLPDEITAWSTSLSHRPSGCYWSATPFAYMRFVYGTGGREWYRLRREDRRRSRHEARRRLRDRRDDD